MLSTDLTQRSRVKRAIYMSHTYFPPVHRRESLCPRDTTNSRQTTFQSRSSALLRFGFPKLITAAETPFIFGDRQTQSARRNVMSHQLRRSDCHLMHRSPAKTPLPSA